MAKKQPLSRSPVHSASSGRSAPGGYGEILTELTQAIAESRHRALATVNRELVCLYWYIGRTIVQQQETANWGDAVVEKLATDLRTSFPDMKGLSRDNVFRMRRFFLADRETDVWFGENFAKTLPEASSGKVGTASRQLPSILGDSISENMRDLILGLSWSHQTIIIGAVAAPAERYFYMSMSLRERWSVRELRRQIDSDLFTRYLSVKSHPEKCLPERSETVGEDTFRIDLLFFHRRLQSLIAIDLKIGKFKPEHTGKSRFYCAALDEQLRLPHENPSIGLVLCKSADKVQVRLALTAAANKIGVATYQTALPDERLIQRRLEQLPNPSETDE